MKTIHDNTWVTRTRVDVRIEATKISLEFWREALIRNVKESRMKERASQFA